MICAVVVAAGLGGLARQSLPPLEPQSPPRAAEQSGASPRSDGVALERIASALEAANRDPDAATEKERAEDDLEAQQDMALWAFWVMIFALAQVGVAIAALVLLKRTLDATRQAVKDTGDATVAMREANDIALQANENTLRAWVFLDTINLSEREDGEKKWWDFLLFVKNSGQSPAKNVTIKLAWQVTLTPGETIDHVVEKWPEPNGSGVLAPGASTMGAAIELTWEQLQSQWISVRCQVDYIDAITGKARATSFRIVAKSVLSADGQIAMRWMQIGNVDAT